MKKIFQLFVFVLLGLALVACDTDNTDTKQEQEQPSQGEEQPSQGGEVVEKELVYVLEYADTFSDDIKFTYDESSNTYTATVDDLTGVVGVEFYLDNALISSATTTVTGVGTDASSPFYQLETQSTSFKVGNATIDDATFVYNATENSLAITYNLIEDAVDVEVTYAVSPGPDVAESGTAVLGDGGKYYFTLTFSTFNRIDIKCNGQIVNAENTDVTGAFKNQVDATWTKDLYLDDLDTNRFVYYMEQTNTYKFIYTPASNGQKAQLEIQWQEPEHGDGLVVVNAQHSTFEVSEADGVYTITTTGSANYSGIQIFYNGEELTSTSCTVSGEAYYADWGTLNATSDKLGLYYQPDDGQSVPGWFSISAGTFTLVYDSTADTLVISK